MTRTGSDVIELEPPWTIEKTLGEINEEEKKLASEEDGYEEEEEEATAYIASLSHLTNRAVLKEYVRLMRLGCVYGVLVREAHHTRSWLRHTMAACDRLLLSRRRAARQRRRKHTKAYLTLLKELLDEVVEQKSTVEGLIRQSWEFLEHDSDTLLFFDVAEIENTWLHLKEKLRKLSTQPWTSKTRLSEIDHYFATRKAYKPCQRPDFGSSSFPCLDSTFSLSSSSEEDRAQNVLTIISSDSQIAKDKKDLEIFISNSTQDQNLDYVSIDITQLKKDQQFQDTKFFIKEGSSLPTFSHFSPLATKPQTTTNRSCESDEFSYGYNYSGSEESIDSHSISGSSLEYLKDEGSSFEDGFHSEASAEVKVMSFAASEDNLVLMKAAFPSSQGNLGMAEATVSSGEGRNSPLGIRASSCGDDSPVQLKRRRMNEDMPGDAESSAGTSPRDSPASLHLMLNPGLTLPLGSTSFDDTFDEFSDSQLSSPGDSPSMFRSKNKEALRGKYRKDELWAAIKSDYHYLMDGEIIETCRRSIYTVKDGHASTESDLSWESDDLMSQTSVSFTEFIQQYKELTDWLNQIQLVTQRQVSSLSEKYLNQTYHEEMLQRSPRRKVFNDYAKQLMRRYPGMKDEINIRLQHLNSQWETLEKAISPCHGYQDEETMLKDLEEDLNGLRKWLHEVESQLLPLCMRNNWTTPELETKLKDHQALQRDIESHSKIVSAVLKLCEHLQQDKNACSNEVEKDALQLVAVNLERRWHAIWLQSLEWQCRLEEAITNGNKGLHPPPLHDNWGPRLGFSKTRHIDISEHLHDISDGNFSDDTFSDQLCDYGLDSDYSNSDIIPFSENEYEKITVDTDCQTEDHEDGQLSPGGASASSKGSGCSSGMDPAIDSALGRSVSDHSINNDHQVPCQSVVQITSDQVNRAVNKVVSFANKEMRAAPEQSLSSKPREASKQMVLKGDSHDVGYSSESHSNDEPDFGCKPLEDVLSLGESSLEVPAEGTPEDSIERPRSLDAVVLRRKQGESEETRVEGGTMHSPLTPEKSWRHSMTSAYDTSSQCSEINSPFDLDATLETSADTSVCTTVERDDIEEDRHNSVQDLISAGSQNFYCMTSLESDADSKIPDGIDTGEDLLHEGVIDVLPVPLVMGHLKHSTSTPIKGRVELYSVGEPDIIEEVENARFQDTFFSQDIVQCGPLDVVCELDELRKERSESLSVELDSEASSREAALSSGDLSLHEAEQVSPVPEVNESIKKLIQQAELLVRDSELGPPPAPKFSRRRKKGRSKHKTSSVGTTESVQSTDTSAMPTEDSHVSSCDASSECTDSEGEFSTASSEDDNVYTSAVLANQAGSIPGIGPHFKSNTLPRTKTSKRCDHNRSVTELYELTNGLDLSPFSISESAIDNLSRKHSAMQPGSLSHRLRRTTSETSSFTLRRYDAPYRAKRRKLKRSASDDIEDKTISASSLSHSQRVCQSVPSSRRQSSQEWQSQSLSSPDKSASGSEALQQDWLIAAERQKMAALQQPTLPGTSEVSESDVQGRPRKVLRNAGESDLDTEDAMLKSMNSTMESFSENAWDNYQDPPYQVASDEPPEEKLDDSSLQWEQTLEFEEDFHLDRRFGSDLRGRRAKAEPKMWPRDKRISTSNSFMDASRADDSDSDLEDFHHVVEESRHQIKVAESVLKRHHKDVMDTGIYMDPSKYVELIATCQTNIKCLEVLNEVIDGEGSVNVTDDDLQHVQDIIEQWEVLFALASERQQQSRELTTMYKELVTIKATLQEIADALDVKCFEDVNELEQSIKDLQAHKVEQQQLQIRMQRMRSSIQEFAARQPAVQMSHFNEDLGTLNATLEAIVDRSVQKVSELQSVLFSWYDFNETHKELMYLVSHERQQLQYLALTYDLITVSLPDAIDTIHDLKIMKSDFEFYENKLWSLRTLSADILALCDETSQVVVRERVAAMDNEVSTVSHACEDLIEALEEKVIAHGGSTLLSPNSPVDFNSQSNSMELDEMGPTPKPAEAGVERPSLLWRILKVAVPMQLAVLVLLGLAYLIDPDVLASFGIVFSPQLRYVRGPPPV